MKKITKKENIFEKYYDGMLAEIKFSDLPKDLLQSDIIDIQRLESFYSENNSWDEHTILIVYREREETDEEFEKRRLESQKFAEENKKRRYENYLKLKKEFEE